MIGCKCDDCEIMSVFLLMDGRIKVRPWTKAFPARRSFRTATQQYVLLSGMAGDIRPRTLDYKLRPGRTAGKPGFRAVAWLRSGSGASRQGGRANRQRSQPSSGTPD